MEIGGGLGELLGPEAIPIGAAIGGAASSILGDFATGSTATPTSDDCGKWMCEGYAQYQKIGVGEKVVPQGPWYEAYGQTESDARYDWGKIVQNSAPPGTHARHIFPKRCRKIK